MQFAKLFEINGTHQVLATIDYNDEDDKYTLNFTTDLGDIRPTISLGFEEEEKCTDAFIKVDHEQAFKMFKAMQDSVNQLTT